MPRALVEVKIDDGEGVYVRSFAYDELTINESKTRFTLVANREEVVVEDDRSY